jgi:hypothetical protein
MPLTGSCFAGDTSGNYPPCVTVFSLFDAHCLCFFFRCWLNGTHRVGWAAYKNKKEPRLQHHDKMDSASIHVSYITFQLDAVITEESLRQLFSSFGPVVDTSIKKSFVDEVRARCHFLMVCVIVCLFVCSVVWFLSNHHLYSLLAGNADMALCTLPRLPQAFKALCRLCSK